ncbi:MAG: DEAD/DEAH box helicase [Promethearchaeota archaeon]
MIKKKGFIEPTLAQKISIPEIMKEKNVLIIAGTGVGKTESAMLPLMDKVSKNKNQPIALLYITPMRSLNRDLLDRLKWWAKKLDLDISVRHGDTSESERASQRESPPHILITTPESLGALLVGRKMREHLKNIRYVIIDEVHELVENKRGVQLTLLLERLRELAGNFQRIALSATVGSPKKVSEFIGGAKIIQAEQNKKYEIRVECPAPRKKDFLLAEEVMSKPSTIARLNRIIELINSHQSILVFSNTRETSEILSSRIKKINKDIKMEVHHGSLSRESRIRSERNFKNNILQSLICTSSLELGIDIGTIDQVIQYLSPRKVSKFIQRIGRSGHQIGKTSKGIILSDDEDLFESVIIAEKAERNELEEIKIHEQALDVLAVQIIGLLMEYYILPLDKIYRIIKRAYPFKNLSEKKFYEIIDFLIQARLVWLEKGKIGRKRKCWEYYFENLSTIPDTIQYKIISIIEGEPIGNLDEEFVAEHGKPGEKFICSGRAWKIIQVEKNKVLVEPIDDIESSIPAWEGELIPVPFSIAQEVGKLRRTIKNKKIHSADQNSLTKMRKIVEKHIRTHSLPDDKNILIEDYKDFIIIHACFGSLVNNTLGRYIAALLSAETGISVNLKTDPYRIILQTTGKPEQVKRIILKAKNIKSVLESELERSSLFKHRFIHVARRFGVVSKKARYDKININKIILQYQNSPVYEETLREIYLEKLDLEKTRKILSQIQENKIKIKIQNGLSKFGEIGLIHQFSEVMKPRLPEEEIFKAFKKRLLNTRVRLICTHCGKYSAVKTIKDIDEDPECPNCGSRLIGVARRTQSNIINILKKKLEKKKLKPDELKEFQTLRRTADLTIVYGRLAVETLAGRGVGPETAARILSKLHPTKEKLYRDILQAEKTFAKNKIYWRS